MNTVIPVENGETLVALRGFLRQQLESGAVEALYVSLGVDGGIVAPALVTEPALLDQADPLTPVMPINGARAVSVLTGKRAPARLGAVLRPCEIRALVELVKLQQADLENVMLIGLDCPGTYELTDYVELHRTGQADLREYLALARQGNTGSLHDMPLRQACQMCDQQPVIDEVDRINRASAAGARRMRIHAVGFPTVIERTQQSGNTGERYATLMRIICQRNGGTFVGLSSTRP